MKQSSMRESVTYMLKAVRIIWQSSPKWSVINLLMIIVRGVIPLMMLLVVKQLIDQVSLIVSSGGTVTLHSLMMPLVLTASFFIINAVTASVHSILRERQSFLVNDHITSMIHHKTTHIRYGYFEDSSYQDIFFRALNESSYRPSAIFYSLAALMQGIITLIAIGVVLVGIHPAMIWVGLLTSIPILWFRITYSRKHYRLLRQQTHEERKTNYYNRILTSKEYAKELRVFNLGSLFAHRYKELRNKLYYKRLRLLLKKTLSEAVIQAFVAMMMILVFGYVIMATAQGKFSIGTMTMYFVALQRGYAALQDFLSRITSLYEDTLFLKNFFEFLNIKTDEGSEMQEKFPTQITNGIEVSGLSFQYPGSNRPALNNVSFSIRKGETIAIVGANGSGKTTLVKLLCGLYEPDTGKITIDNQPLSSISRSELAKNITVIFQDFMLYNVSARENIWLGNIARQSTDDNIYQAAQKAGIHQLFINLNNGYDTGLGTLFQESEMLSQGEWQRTALARAFFNEAQIIILDEPTSSLDAFTEADITHNFKEITKDKTSIIISHRLSTIKMADRIIVMDNHSIAETGTYQELMTHNGVFNQMMEYLERE